MYCSTDGLLFKSFTKCQESFDSASSSRSHLRYVEEHLYLLQRIWFMKKLLRSESSKLASRVEICRLADGACWRWSIKDWMTHDKKTGVQNTAFCLIMHFCSSTYSYITYHGEKCQGAHKRELDQCSRALLCCHIMPKITHYRLQHYQHWKRSMIRIMKQRTKTLLSLFN